ncbi:MAG: chemotaxis protein CheA [Campylobacterales bacterium]|nr:chemotaxis protein CheA [Campylobacterales bacterium]
MNKEKLKQIFIEEANEIIETLDVDIINFEEDPTDRTILDKLFRGVHTLKGSANSFGFTRLGEFVHHFEDALDHFRNSDDEITSHIIDVFLESVDVIKAVLEYETEGTEGNPENYDSCLKNIQEIMAEKKGQKDEQPTVVEESVSTGDLAQEFDEEESKSEVFSDLEDGEKLVKIQLKFDEDIYFRGYDHGTFFKLISEEGRILESFWDMSKIVPLSEFDPQKCYISIITIHLATKSDKETLEEIFEFVEPEEYNIEFLENSSTTVPTPVTEESSSSPVTNQAPSIPEPAPEPIKEETVAVVEEPQPLAPTSTPPQQEPAKAKKAKKKDEAKSFVKIDTLKLDELFDSVGELVIAQNFLGENQAIRNLENEGVNKTIETLSKITRLIQNRVMSLRMVPIKDTFDKMKRVVRDSAKKVNKEITLNIVGEDTEIDKTMIDKLSDPLIHLIRNSVDHGVEATGEDRKNAGKDISGQVYLKAFHKGGNIAIEVSDDGRGIDADVILKKAIERGIADPEANYTEQQIFNFIMQPGFSTAAVISDISGRGVGLDVVKTFIEKLHGKIEIESVLGEGTSFRILLPLTLAIIDGMLVRSEDDIYIIPTLSIVESFRPTEDILHTAQENGEFVNLRDELLPIIRLNHVLGVSDKKSDLTEGTLVCVENENGRFTIFVDELVGRQQVVIKSLGKALSSLKEISGGAVMGNGDVALILDIDGIY